MATESINAQLRETLTCPFTLAPLIQAVNLSPCCHKVNQVAAETHYGPIVDGSCTLKDKECKVCKTTVITYAPDSTVRAVTALAFGYKNDPAALEEKSKEFNLPHPMTYPGIPAVFEHTIGDWRAHDTWGECCREIEFISKTPDSLIKDFKLLGYDKGGVAISVVFRKSVFLEYLLAHGFRDWQKPNLRDHYYRTRTASELQTLFKIIALNNDIPAPQFQQVSEIVQKGRCNLVKLWPFEGEII